MTVRNPRLATVAKGLISIPRYDSGPNWVMYTRLGPISIGKSIKHIFTSVTREMASMN